MRKYLSAYQSGCYMRLTGGEERVELSSWCGQGKLVVDPFCSLRGSVNVGICEVEI
jgi:hypothetical protein